LWRGADRITLAPKAFVLLEYLAQRAGRLVTHDELLSALWPDSFVQPEVLKTHVADIRQALGDDAKTPKFIATHARRGYRFIAAVRTHAGDSSDDRSSAAASIAVLPFVNVGGEKENEYFADGLAEDIINELTKIEGLKVIARTSAFAFKGQNRDVRSIAEALGVANILEGSVRRAENRVRVTAQLITASDGSHLWSARYDRDVTDILTIQDEIAQAIAGALKISLRGPGERKPANAEAYQAYLEGRYHVQHVTAESIQRARECYERAMRLDPGYALPHSGLALQAYYQVLYLAQRPRDLAPAALASLGRALQLDPRSAQCHVVRGVFSAFYEYNWRAAEEHFTEALKMDPSSPMVRMGRALWFLVPTRRLHEALDEVRQAVSLDPLSPAVRTAELWVLYTMTSPDAAERSRELLRLFPSLPICRFAAALSLLRQGCIDEAATCLEDGLKIVPTDVFLLGVLALARAAQGRASDAQEIRLALEQRSAAKYVPLLSRAYCAESCGDIESVYALLNAAIDEREPLAALAVVDRNSDRPEHSSLLAKMNLA
jgi:serine/threonine-protein kinase